MRIMMSRKMRLAGHVARRREEECIQSIGMKIRRGHKEDEDVDEWTILKWIIEI
jgi:hypothetical protein